MNVSAEDFADPGPAFRGKPFWSWNGKLDAAELIRQIHVFKQMGFGGFFMHSRTGLVTEYLGDEWFRLTNRCADEAASLGMEAWLYDEDRWPSGTAGGLVTENPKHAQKFLSLRFSTSAAFAWDHSVIAAFVCDLQGLSVTNCRRLRQGEAADAEGTVLIFRIETAARSSFYNGHTYVDTMSAEATDLFLQLTHEKYRSHCGRHLGITIQGIFTDEPHRGPVMCGFSLSNANRLWMAPWTPTLFDEFLAAFGYDLLDRLPELFLQLDGQPVSQVKWHYMEMLQRLFLGNFAKPMYEWCTRHGLKLTGHMLHEDSLSAQAAMQGSLMRSYEFMHLPGVDVLTEGNRNYWIAKQLCSAARQLGHKQLLSELYGCTGWQMTFENHKAVGDWQALFGINVRCHHLSWYTMESEAKRDYPGSISYQSAWFKEYEHVENYFARLGVFLSLGTPCCDVLVINPVESVWCQIHGGWSESLAPQSEAIQKLERDYSDLFHWLTGAHLDFDYGDEEMMSRLARVDRSESGAVIRFGHAVYRVVVVGQMTTIRSTTLHLLNEFNAAGGTVIFAGKPPRYADALQSAAASDLADRATKVPWNLSDLVQAILVATREPRCEVVDSEGRNIPRIFCQLRRDQTGNRYLTAVNTDPLNGIRGAKIRVNRPQSGPGSVANWDCETGDRYAVAAQNTAGWTEFSVNFAPSGSAVHVIGEGADAGLRLRPVYVEQSRNPVEGPFEFELTESNVCVLDTARFQIDDGDWQPAREILKVDRAVRTAFGLAWRSGEMVQPWYLQKTEPVFTVRGWVRLAFDFNISVIPASIDLGIEHPEAFRITLNGTSVDSSAQTQWWVDHAIRRVRLPAHALRLGANAIQLEIPFHEGIGLEAIYLLGSFGVSITNGISLTQLPATLKATDVVEQGLPFYSGAIRYRLPIPKDLRKMRLRLELPDLSGACVNISSSGRKPIIMAWRPFKLDVTDLAQGASELIVEVMLTRRNTFGPLHQLPARAPHCAPDSFMTEGEHWSDHPVLHQSGLLASPVLVEATT